MNKSLQLMLTFAKIGSFTFGGGYAMIPAVQHEIIDRRGWVDSKEFLELLTLAQSAPGPIILNTSVFVGYRVDGYRGAICSTLGIIMPSFLVILLIAAFFPMIRNNPVVVAVFKGMGPAVVALILSPIYSLSKGLGLVRYIFVAAAAVAIWYFKFSPIYAIIAGAVGGLIYFRLREGRRKQ